MSMPTFPLRSEQDRAKAIDLLRKVPLDRNFTWSLKEEARSDPQNRRMWAMLRDISSQVVWHGQKLHSEDWKHIFGASVEKQRAVPGLDGGFVVMGISTRGKSKAWFSDMFEVMEAFAAEQGVKFTIADHWGFTNAG